MTPDSVATYLKEHPEFFELHADMLADIYIPHPHGGRAIPISERQILTLRERCRQLESRLRSVIAYGEENDAIGQKVHRLALALLGARDLASVVTSFNFNLREDFAVPHVALRVWGEALNGAPPELTHASEATRCFAAALTGAHCGGPADADVTSLFADAAPHLKSFSFVPLRAPETFGLLALASEDPQRFYAEMGTVYLNRIGEMIGTAVLRHAASA